MFAGNFEYQLISAARGPLLLSGRRRGLHQNVEDDAINCMSGLLPAEREQEFRRYLQIIFKHMFEVELHRLRQTRSAADESSAGCLDVSDEPNASNVLPRVRVPKFATVAASELEKLQADYRALRLYRRPSHPSMVRFFRKLRRNPRVFGVLEVSLRSGSGLHLRSFFLSERRRDIFGGLEKAFEVAAETISLAQRPGPSDPVMEQLARALAALYLEMTGQPPGRSNLYTDEDEQIEGGRYLQLCRLMARAIKDALPEHLARQESPDMVKVARRMVAELKAENAAA